MAISYYAQLDSLRKELNRSRIETDFYTLFNKIEKCVTDASAKYNLQNEYSVTNLLSELENTKSKEVEMLAKHNTKKDKEFEVSSIKKVLNIRIELVLKKINAAENPDG